MRNSRTRAALTGWTRGRGSHRVGIIPGAGHIFVSAMNQPGKNVIEEIAWMVALELEFIDLTLEPPVAASARVDAREIRRALDDFGMEVVGHTAYYLPLASPFEEIRRGVVEELKRCL